MTGPLTRWAWCAVVLWASPAPACEVALGAPRARADAGWERTLEMSSSSPALAVVTLRERGRDVILALDGARSDVVPTRHAIERVSAWGIGKTSWTLAITGNAMAVPEPPEVEAHCLPWNDPATLPLQLLGWAADASARAEDDGNPEYRAGWAESARRALSGLERLAEARQVDAALLASAAHLQAHLDHRDGQLASAASAFDLADRRWSALGERELAAAARFNRAQALLQSGQGPAARQLLDGLLSASTKRDAPIVHFWARNDVCWSQRLAGDFDAAVRCFETLLPEQRAAGEAREAANTLCNLGAVQGAMRKWTQALETILRCEAERRGVALPYDIAHALLLKGWIQASLGQATAALRTLEEARDFAVQGGATAQVWDIQRWTAQAWIDLDMADRAMDAYRSAAPDAAQDPGRFGLWHLAQGQVASILDDIDAARRHLREAGERLRAVGNLAAATNADCLLAVVDAAASLPEACPPLLAAQAHLVRGRWQDAVTHARKAHEAGEHPALARLLGLVAQARLDGSADIRALQDLVAESRGLFAGREVARGRFLMRLAYELVTLHREVGGPPELLMLARDARLESTAESAALGLAQERLPEASPQALDPGSVPAAVPLAEDAQLAVSIGTLGNTYLLVFARDATPKVVEVDAGLLEVAARTPANASRLADAVALDRWLAPSTRRLALVLHGTLGRLPWAMMAIDGPSAPRLGYRPLIDQASLVHYVPSQPAMNRHASERVVILQGDSGQGLPGVSMETRRLATLAAQKGWRVSEALPPPEDVENVGILHIGGHGWASRHDPSGNVVRLAQGASWQDVPLPLALAARADVVVLGACETAAGTRSDWRMDQSLASRMASSGAGHVLAHLWPVADMPAARLHDAFYENLLSGSAGEDALAAAQRSSIASLRDHRPADWAGAVMLAALPRSASMEPLRDR